MSFGKRTRQDQKNNRPGHIGRAVIPKAADSSNVDEDMEFELPFEMSRGQIIGLNITVAFLLITFGWMFAGDLFAERSIRTVPAASIGGGGAIRVAKGHPLEFVAAEGNGGLSSIDAEINAQCFGSRMQRRQRVALDRQAGNSKIVIQVPHAMVSDYLLCSMNEQQQRFCQSFYRERLLERIKSVIRFRRMVKAQFKRLTSNRMSRRALKRAVEMSGDGGRIQTNDPMSMPLVDQHLGEGLRRLMEDGYISTSDFGWFTSPPKELAPFMAEPTRRIPCS